MGQNTSSSTESVLQTTSSESLSLLLQSPSTYITQVDSEGRNALHLASSYGRVNLVSLLVNLKKLDINSSDLYGNTALHLAVFSNYDEVTLILLENNANINSLDINGMTPLHWGVYQNNMKCVQLLMEHKASVDIKNNKGQTAHDIAHTLKKSVRENMLMLLNQPIVKGEEEEEKENEKETGETLSPRDKAIADICGVWGFIKYTHPYLAYRNDINWDKALVDALHKILEEDQNSESHYFQTIDQMIRHLHDPNTYIVYEPEGQDTIPSWFQPPSDLPTPVTSIKLDGKRPQPYVEITSSSVAIIFATDYTQFTNYTKQDNLLNAIISANTTSQAIVFDLRGLNGLQKNNEQYTLFGMILEYLFENSLRPFLKEDLELPIKRQNVFHGLPEYKQNFPQTFYHGMITSDVITITSDGDHPLKVPAYHHNTLKPTTFIINKYTPQNIINIITALHTKKLCTFLYHTETHVGEEFHEPGISVSVHELGGGIRVYVRQNETINSDHTIGFYPDLVVVKGDEHTYLPKKTPMNRTDLEILSDPVLRIACDIVTKKIEPKQKRRIKVRPTQRRREDPYGEMTNPPPEYRLLALCRLWTSVKFFYPHKSEIISPMKFLFVKFIPKFLSGNSELEYFHSIAEFFREFRNSDFSIKPTVSMTHVMTHVPPVRVTMVEGKLVVVGGRDLGDVRVGDVVVGVDGVLVPERLVGLVKMGLGSYGCKVDERVIPWVLAGGEGSVAKLNIERVSNGVPTVLEVLIPRAELTHHLIFPFSLDPYMLLEETDKTGERIGYINLTTLSPSQVNQAINHLSSTNSLILDFRGYSKGTFYSLGPYLSKKKGTISQLQTPLFVPSLLVDGDGIDPMLNITYQSYSSSRSNRDNNYSGKVVALIDSTTTNQGPQACLFLHACCPDTIFIGSPTAGLMGNVTNVILPGNIEVSFTGMGISYPDGKVLKEGFVPDIEVNLTIDCILKQEDKILSTAISYLKNDTTKKK